MHTMRLANMTRHKRRKYQHQASQLPFPQAHFHRPCAVCIPWACPMIYGASIGSGNSRVSGNWTLWIHATRRSLLPTAMHGPSITNPLRDLPLAIHVPPFKSPPETMETYIAFDDSIVSNQSIHELQLPWRNNGWVWSTPILYPCIRALWHNEPSFLSINTFLGLCGYEIDSWVEHQ